MFLRTALALWLNILMFIIFSRTAFADKRVFGLKKVKDWKKRAITDNGAVLEGGSAEGLFDLLAHNARVASEVWMLTNDITYVNSSNEIYVDIVGQMTGCKPGLNCHLEILAFNGKTSDLSNDDKANAIAHVRKNSIAIHNLTSVSMNSNTSATFKVPLLYPVTTLAFTAKGTSWRIYNLTMYYNFCAATITNNIHLPETNATENATAICSENSSPLNGEVRSTIQCPVNGTWGAVSSSNECLCNKGFEPRGDGKGCKACSTVYVKPERSNSNCNKCLETRESNNDHTLCECPENKYAENRHAKCYGLPGRVKSLKITGYDDTLNITWTEPVGAPEELLVYDVTCGYCDHSEPTVCSKTCPSAKYTPGQHNITSNYMKIENLELGYKYNITVYSKLNLNLFSAVEEKWKSSSKEYILGTPTPKPDDHSSSSSSSKDPNQLYIILGAAGAAVLLILFFLVLIIMKSRRSKGSCSGKDNTGYNELELPSIGQRMYVDPTNYDDPQTALKDFANEIEPKALHLERVLGGGEFGDVYKGTLAISDGTTIPVAAKTLKHDSDERSRKDFFLEASAMGQFKDPHVIKLEGIITKTIPHMIVTEYMSNGSLDNFLKQNDGKLTDLQLIGMARGVASGMKYLAKMNFVHRDLAARNILVNDTLVCKVADFGLSRELESADSSMGEYCTSGGKIPVRWTAPEAIKYRKFSTASDIWSYGILVWEIMTFGNRPYWDWDNFTVMERVDEGFRLPAPTKCPKRVHELIMLRCWEKERNQRPQFENIVSLLDEWIRSPEMIREDSENVGECNRNSLPPNFDTANLTPIKEWLTEIKMSSYMTNFEIAGYEHLSQLAGMMDSDLEDMGITLVGHKNKMLRTIRTLSISSEQQQHKEAWKRAKSLRV